MYNAHCITHFAHLETKLRGLLEKPNRTPQDAQGLIMAIGVVGYTMSVFWAELRQR